MNRSNTRINKNINNIDPRWLARCNEEEFPKQISSSMCCTRAAARLGSFRGVFVCAARGRAWHNKIAACIQRRTAREIARLPVRTPTIMQSSTPGLVSTIGERPRISTRARPSKCTYLPENLTPPGCPLPCAFPRN